MKRHSDGWLSIGATGLVCLGLYGLVLMCLPRPKLGVFGGDQGVKYLQVQSLAAGHAWLSNHATSVDPKSDMFPLRAPFAFAKDGRFYSVFLNPVTYLAAPLYRLAGTDGCLWITMSSAVGIAIVTAMLGLFLTPRPVDWIALGLFVLLGTPVWFYGLVFWEHAPAVFLCLIATAVLCRDGVGRLGIVSAGALLGVAAASRPEAAVYLAALAVAWAATTRRVAASVTVLLVATVVWVAVNSALPVGSFTEHLRPKLVGLDSFLASRWHYAEGLLGGFLADSATGKLQLVIAGLAVATLLLVSVGVALGRFTWMAICSLGFVVTVAAAVPAILSAQDGRTQLTGLLTSCPLMAIGLLCAGAVLRLGTSPRAKMRLDWRLPFLSSTVLLFLIVAVALAPNDGGNQWGARYLLVAYPLLSCIALAFYRNVPLPTTPLARRMTVAVLVLAATAGIAVQSIGVRNYVSMMRDKNSALARMAALPGRYVLTSLWFVPQEAALLTVRRDKVFLLVRSPAQLRTALTRLSRAGQDDFTFVETDRAHGLRHWGAFSETDGFTFHVHPFQLHVAPFVAGAG